MEANFPDPRLGRMRGVFVLAVFSAILPFAGCKKQEPASAPPEPAKKQTSVDSLLQSQAPAEQAQPTPANPATPVEAAPAGAAAAPAPETPAAVEAAGYAKGTYVPPMDSVVIDTWTSYLRQYNRQYNRLPNNINEVAAMMHTSPPRVPAGYNLVVDKERQEFVLAKIK